MTQHAYGRQQPYSGGWLPTASDRRPGPTYSQVVEMAVDRLRSGKARSRYDNDQPRFFVAR